MTLLAGAPLAILLVLHRPPEAAHVQSLLGPWHYAPGEQRGAERIDFDDSAWAIKSAPKDFRTYRFEAREAWLRRTLELEQPLLGQRLYFTMGEIHAGAIEVYFDGVRIGAAGDLAHRVTADWNSWYGFEVPLELAHPGRHVMALHFESRVFEPLGINDTRLWIGRADPLELFHQHAQQIEDFLRSAPILVMWLLCLLLAVLARLSTGREERRGAWYAVALLAAAAIYMSGWTGIGFPPTMPELRWTVIATMVPLQLATVVLFMEYFFLGRATLLGRGLLGVGVVLTGVTAVLLGLGVSAMPVINVNYSYAGFTVLYSCGLAIAMTLRPAIAGDWSTVETRIPMTVALVLASAAGVTDILKDWGLVQLPRLYVVAIANLPIMAGVMVVARFLGVYRRNETLTLSLTERNTELARALAEAREANRLKGEFVASISHELRTPLNSIINIPEGLLEEFEGEGPSRRYVGHPEDTAQYLSTLHKNGVHLLSVVNQLLDFSKLEAGRMSLTLENVSVRQAAQDILKTVQNAFASSKVRLELSGDVDTTLKADSVKLAQVLLNLLSNAVKFSPDGGKVSLHVHDEGHALLFSVKDEGIGIAPENQALVFESFRQVEGGSTRKFGGTGLGLPIARQLVELHGGALWLESAMGQGSTFFARFPKAPHQQPKPQTRPGKASILLVDDDAFTLETLKLTLRDLPDVELLSLDNPQKALPTIHQAKPALLLLDVMMPKLSGLSVLRSLRESDDGKSIPVLVLSAYPANRDVVLGLGASWMDKPWTPDALKAEVLRLLGRDVKRAA